MSDMERAWGRRTQKTKTMVLPEKQYEYQIDLRGEFFAGFKAAQSLNKPVPIDDPIVETWKDGRTIILMRLAPKCEFHGVTARGVWKGKTKEYNWQYRFNKTHWPATHAMLVPEITSIKEVSHD